MITNYKGTVLLGSSDLQTSVANEEIIDANTRVINFQLQNNTECHISINGCSPKYFRANQGITFPIVSSCKIIEDGIVFNWTGQGE